MIPLTGEQTLMVKTKAGNEIELKYLTEFDNQVKYLDLTRKEKQERDCFITHIKDELKIGSNEIIDKEMDDKINLLAYNKLIEDRESDPSKYLETIDCYIDVFVKGNTKFRLFEKYEVYRFIQDNIVELTGLTIDEVKN
jgi:hypothetical protein